MINNNMEMIKQMDNISNYAEYIALCEKLDIPSNDLSKYCLGIGILSVALFKYPDKDWQDAYLQILVDMNTNEELEKKENNGCCLGAEKPLGIIEAGKGLLRDTKEHIAQKLKNVSDEEYKRRIDICKQCEWITEHLQCRQCKCFMGVKARWDIKNGCKLKKW